MWHVCATAGRAEDNFVGLVLSLHLCANSGDWIQTLKSSPASDFTCGVGPGPFCFVLREDLMEPDCPQTFYGAESLSAAGVIYAVHQAWFLCRWGLNPGLSACQVSTLTPDPQLHPQTAFVPLSFTLSHPLHPASGCQRRRARLRGKGICVQPFFPLAEQHPAPWCPSQCS